MAGLKFIDMSENNSQKRNNFPKTLTYNLCFKWLNAVIILKTKKYSVVKCLISIITII